MGKGPHYNRTQERTVETEENRDLHLLLGGSLSEEVSDHRLSDISRYLDPQAASQSQLELGKPGKPEDPRSECNSPGKSGLEKKRHVGPRNL